MRKTIIGITALLLTACAVTPQELQRDGERLEFTTTQAPTEAGACMTRNALQRRDHGDARAYPGEAPGTVEFFMRTMYFAVLRPEGTGSRGTVWMMPFAMMDKHARWAEIVKGC